MTREEASDAIFWLIIRSADSEEGCYIYSDEIKALNMAIEALKQPEQKRGKWVNRYRAKWDRTLYWFRACSECDFERDDCNSEKDTMYCPNCGAKMEEEQCQPKE